MLQKLPFINKHLCHDLKNPLVHNEPSMKFVNSVKHLHDLNPKQSLIPFAYHFSCPDSINIYLRYFNAYKEYRREDAGHQRYRDGISSKKDIDFLKYVPEVVGDGDPDDPEDSVTVLHHIADRAKCEQ